MTYIHIVRPFYIDNELQLKKIEIFSKKTPRGPGPHFGAHLWKSAWTPIFLAGPLLKFEYGYPKIDSS